MKSTLSIKKYVSFVVILHVALKIISSYLQSLYTVVISVFNSFQFYKLWTIVNFSI